MGTSTFLHRLLRLDAVACMAGGAAVAAASGLLAPALGIGTPWPIVAAGVALVVYGEAQWAIARNRGEGRPSRRAVGALVAADLGFAAVLLDIALTDPFGADAWARWAMAAVADVSAAVGVAKWYAVSRRTGRTSADRGRTTPPKTDGVGQPSGTTAMAMSSTMAAGSNRRETPKSAIGG